MQLAASAEGQQGNCPSCGVPTVITATGTPPDPIQAPTLSQQPPPQYPQITPQSTNTLGPTSRSNGDSIVARFFASLSITGSGDPVGDDRYPNLTKYLEIMDIVIRISFIIALVLLCIGMILGVGSGLLIAISAFGDRIEYVYEGLGTMVGSILGGIIYFFVLLWCRLVAFASLEMIRVFMDNEANTRNLLDK